jgi:hypothetical protein
VCNPCPQRIETTAVKSCSFIFIDGNENDFSHCFVRFVLKRITGTDYCVSSAKASGTNPRDLVVQSSVAPKNRTLLGTVTPTYNDKEIKLHYMEFLH